ncbi:DedA family protein [Mesorhizobium sp. M1A.F.Ca.IN.022.07.1.1]|uniref:YqaA family protein n=1 Tax=unclassified Mesorhizobium TaxID=325217 RepID=UPI000F74D939|nr:MULTISPECIES: YqaA family protein [unclassified Mesorhizobium]AZO61843.1 DedA family protein [Mesorhizobium sp. M1A.F.Ca.IN.022.06.1.1]MCT2581172.1 DedA family protein [Mesorhizobium sp. P13.3]MDF3170198.1 DedA family protein [Mesorhizobium sp. P16.1]MDF3181168.1 DedA family protein [Mesorhizobium sp. P17.1]MDF3187084.1 DedA family protein [Mesorhizobium sp. ICCV3110.1]
MTGLAVYGSLFVSAFLAATVLPVSSEVVLVGLLATGRGDPALLFTVATIGNTLGSVVNWILGRGIDALRSKQWIPITPRQFERASRMFRRYGAWTLLFAWLPVVGDAFTVVAGAARVRLALFVVLVGLGKAARYAAVTLVSLWAAN